MKVSARLIHKSLLTVSVLGVLAGPLQGWQPNASDLDHAIRGGDFATYLGNTSTWLEAQVPATPSESALVALLKNPLLWLVLDQRQLIAKVRPDKLAAFVKAQRANQGFLDGLLRNASAMDLFLEGAVPIGHAARERNEATINSSSLEIWQGILAADPDAKSGIYQKLAIATALAPPGTGAPGAGQVKPPVAPLARYRHFKTAHQNKELFPSFDKLTVWEYQKVVQSGASNEDLAWGRAMVNTYRPDLRTDEMVVNSTSFVWRRASPHPYTDYKSVLSGGGKCGPRSSWAVFICQAFGIPAIGVGQPGHACVAFKAANPMSEPQPGSAWKVGFGGGWNVSNLEGMKGPDFLAGVAERDHAVEFSQVEHLRWLAAALSKPERAAAVMAVAHAMQQKLTTMKTDLGASLKAEEAEAEPGAVKESRVGKSQRRPVVPAIAMPGAPANEPSKVIQVEAAAFETTGGQVSWGGQIPRVVVLDRFMGGKQVYFQPQMKSQWADYPIEVPTDGVYLIVMKAACVNAGQALEICLGSKLLVTVPIALSDGLWKDTNPVELLLAKGRQTLRVQTSPKEPLRGIALHSFALLPKPR